MKLHVTLGTVDYTVVVFIQDSSATDGSGLTGLDDTKVDAYYYRVNTDNDIEKGDVGIADLVAITSVHSDGGFIEIDSTNLPGFYRLDLPDALFAAGNWSSGVRLYDAGDNNVADCVLEFQLISATRGLVGTALPDAAADAAGGVPISDAGGLDMDAIVADTNELQTNQGNWATAVGFSTHSAADVLSALGNGDWATEAGGTGDQLSDIPDMATATTQATLATSTALATAQSDLDTITGSDGVTLATTQANYAPATATALATAQSDLDTLTGSDGVTLATAQANYAPAKASDIPTANNNADAVLNRAIQTDPTAKEYTLRFIILQMMNSNTVDNDGYLTVYNTSDVEVAQLPLTTDSDAEPITGIS